MHKNKCVGTRAESLAADYLRQQGLKLITQNFYSRFGEIDLIMQDDETLVFIEVKKRSAGIGVALESISWSKQQKLVRASKFYLTKLGRDVACRFDAVVINGANTIEWLKNIIIL